MPRVGVLTFDYAGALLDANDAFLEMAGYTRDEVAGQKLTWRDFTPPEYREASERVMDSLLESGRGGPYEKEYFRKDGSRVWFMFVAAALGDGTICEYAIDISDRKRAEGRFRESEERLRALVGNLPGGAVFIVDRDLRYLIAEGEALAEAGFKSEDFVGRTPSEALPSAIASEHEALYRKGLAGDEFEREHDLHNHSYLSRGVPLKDAAGEIYAVLAISYDITARKQAEERLRESERRYAALAEALPQLVWTTEPDGSVDYLNERWQEYTGIPQSEFYDWGWVSIVHPDDLQHTREVWTECLRTGQPFEVKHRFRNKEGNYCWFLARGIPLRNARGEIIKWFGTYTDVDAQIRSTEEREQLLAREQAARAEADAANRLKDEFLATLSHELRTPLTAVLGWTRMLRSSNFDEEASRKALATIDRNAQAQVQIIEDVLDVSRIVTGKLRLEMQSTDLKSVIEAALDSVRPAAAAKEIRLETEFDTAAGPVLTDADRMQQVVWNLLSNAIKFTPRKGQVGVRLGRVDSHVEIRVSDTGQGMSPDFLPYIFDRFRQADSSTTRRHGGLGLGLALVRHLVELQGGRVWAESDGEGQGSAFTLRLPLMPVRVEVKGERQALEPRMTNTEVKVDTSLSLAGLHLLVVDDEPDARELLKLVLEEAGAVATTAASAAEALENVRRVRPDVLVSDIGMPEVDGYDLIRQIRELPENAGGRTPAVALTAYAREEDRERALAVGFDLHVTKPIDPAELVKTVADLSRRVS